MADEYDLGIPTARAGRAGGVSPLIPTSPATPPFSRDRHPGSKDQGADAPRSPEPEEPELRPGETDLGRPPQVPKDLAPLSAADRQALAIAEQAAAARELAEAEELLAADPEVLRWAGWFANPIAAALLLAAAATLGLFVYAQALNVLSQLAAQPPAVRYAGYALLAVLSGAVLLAAGRLLVLYFRLRRNRQVRLRGLQELSDRTRTRWLAHAKTAEAKARLEAYLKDYPVTPDLTPARDALLDPARYSSAGEWFDQFRGTFQAKLDERADARIRYWSNRAWVVTALAPNGLYDSLATTYFGFAMLADLCRVYNLRAGRAGTAVLLGRVFFHAYLAGQVGDWENIAADQYDQLFHEACQIAGVGIGTGVAGKVLGKVGAKATTGYLNKLLLARLGAYACRLLRPVA